MPELQYRTQTDGTGEISGWRDLGPDVARWDYRNTGVRLEYIEIRIKPEFEPGYFWYTNGNTHVSAHWFDEDPGEDYQRVNVTPAE